MPELTSSFVITEINNNGGNARAFSKKMELFES
jgi:hypothetical protein